MKVNIKVDAELIPIINLALKEYTERFVADTSVAKPTPPKPSTPKPAAKKRGRPRGSKTKTKPVVLETVKAA